MYTSENLKIVLRGISGDPEGTHSTMDVVPGTGQETTVYPLVARVRSLLRPWF